MDYITIIIILFFLVITVSFIFFYYWIYIKRKYSRERFAFRGLSTISLFLLTAMMALLAHNWIEQIVLSIMGHYGLEIPKFREESIILNIVFILLGVILLGYIVITLHSNWGGPFSDREIKAQEIGKRTDLINNARFYFWAKRKGESISLYKEAQKPQMELFQETEPDKRPWHLRAAILLKLRDNQFDINAQEDWYRDNKCFISKYGKNKYVGVLCVYNHPTEQELENFILLVNQSENLFHKHFVCVESLKEKSYLIQYKNKKLEYRFKEELFDSIFLISPYELHIKRFFKDKLIYSELSLEQIYVPIGGNLMKTIKKRLIKDKYIEKVDEYVTSWLLDQTSSRNENLEIMGEYGQGKTVLAHKIVSIILNNPKKFKRIPILVSLRGQSPRTVKEPIDILGGWAREYNVPLAALRELHKAGRLLIILDGFDEMDLIGDTYILQEHFRKIWGLAKYQNSKIVITGRPNLFRDEYERIATIGIYNKKDGRPFVRAIYLNKMSTNQIEEALRDVNDDTREQILDLVREHKKDISFMQLINRPSTLFQLSHIWDEDLLKKKNRINSAEIIERFLIDTYDRQQFKESSFLTANERDYFLNGIAIFMVLENGLQNKILNSKLENYILKLWNSYPQSLEPYIDSHEGLGKIEKLPGRLKEQTSPIETINRDIRTAGILVNESSDNNGFRFSHKSYFEFLVSKFYVIILAKPEYSRNDLIKAIAVQKATDFIPSKMKFSPDIKSFTAEFLASRIELRNKSGESIPIKNNESKYEEYIFKKFNNAITRILPNLSGLLSFHPIQTIALGLFITSIILPTILLSTEGFSSIYGNVIEAVLIGILVIWVSIISYYKVYDENKFFINKSLLHYKHLVFLDSLKPLGIKNHMLNSFYAKLIESDLTNTISRNLMLGIIAIIIAITGLLIGITSGLILGKHIIPLTTNYLVPSSDFGLISGILISGLLIFCSGLMALLGATLGGGKVTFSVSFTFLGLAIGILTRLVYNILFDANTKGQIYSFLTILIITVLALFFILLSRTYNEFKTFNRIT